MKNYLIAFKKLITEKKESFGVENQILEQIETIFEGISKCARKMQHATKYIDFFVGDILDYSVLNEASENFQKRNNTFDIRKAITTVVDMVADKSIMKTITI